MLKRGLTVPSSGLIDLAIGMVFVFGVTAVLASVFTEAIARLVGLRGGYLLTGLRELVDSGAGSTNLREVETDYQSMQNLLRGSPPPSPPSATGALLGGPILGNQGVAGQMFSRRLTLGPTRRTGRLPKMTADRQAGRLWSQRRSLPAYISPRHSRVTTAEHDITSVAPRSRTGTESSPIANGDTGCCIRMHRWDSLTSA